MIAPGQSEVTNHLLVPICFRHLLISCNWKVAKRHVYGPRPYALYLWRKHSREVDKQKHLPSRASLSPGSMLFTDRRIYSLYSGKGTGFREESISFENFWMKIPLMPCSSCCVSFFSAWAFVWFRPMRANSSGVMSPSPFKSVNSNSFFAPCALAQVLNIPFCDCSDVRTSAQSQKGMFPISADNGETYKRTVRWKPILRGIKNIQHSTRLLVTWCQMCFLRNGDNKSLVTCAPRLKLENLQNSAPNNSPWQRFNANILGEYVKKNNTFLTSHLASSGCRMQYNAIHMIP